MKKISILALCCFMSGFTYGSEFGLVELKDFAREWASIYADISTAKQRKSTEHEDEHAWLWLRYSETQYLFLKEHQFLRAKWRCRGQQEKTWMFFLEDQERDELVAVINKEASKAGPTV